MTKGLKQQWKTEKKKVISRFMKDTSILRFTTAGNVDDGKSTLIGRLLYDSKAIFEDQMEHIDLVSKNKGLQEIDLSLLTDGLRDEREQGITIDVAYRYFSTPKRKFIIADTPGHIQYTRNMFTGASTANVALILIDARTSLTEQTHRHSFLASLLQIPHLIVCVNKMDLVDYSEEVFDSIVSSFESFSAKLSIKDIHYIPISALKGDNVVDRSPIMNWYNGSTLLNLLETIHITSDENLTDVRFPVQGVIRPHNDEFHDFRAYSGRIAGGILKPGDGVMVMPHGLSTEIEKIYVGEKEVSEAFSPMSVSIKLKHDLDVSRGDMIVRENNQPHSNQDIDGLICWMDRDAPRPGTKYILRHTSREVKAVVKTILYKIDINTLHRNEDDLSLAMNDIARIQLRTTAPIFTDNYRRNRSTGSFILIDPSSNQTVAAGVIQ